MIQSVDISASASISPQAKIGNNVTVGPFVIISAGSVIGDNVVIEPSTIIYENVHIGNNTRIGAQCILGERLGGYQKSVDYLNPTLIIGPDSIIRSGAILYAGSKMGRGFQTGNRCVIRESSIFGDNCSFGTLSQSDGMIQVGDNCRFHNNVFIATHTTVEDNVHFYPMSCTVDSLHPPCQIGREGPTVGAGTIIGAKVLLLPRVKIGKRCVIAGASVVTHDVPEGMVVAGAPAKVLKKREEVRCHLEDRPAYEVALESAKESK
ncbi:MAG TPA: DapH/DapD/GlmU-related protein [Drouetiella sp.]